MSNKTYSITKIVCSSLLIISAFLIWALKNFTIYLGSHLSVYSFETEISLDGNLFLNYLIIVVCIMCVIYINKSILENNRLFNILKCVVSALGISISLVILFNLFVAPEQINDLTGIFYFDWIIVLELAIPFSVMLLINSIFSVLHKKKMTTRTIKF